MAEMGSGNNGQQTDNRIATSERVSHPIIPIGSIIRDELRRQERTVTWLSRKIHCDRRNIYDIFNRDNIDTTLLMRISYALGVDFFKIFSDAMQSVDIEGFTLPRHLSENMFHTGEKIDIAHYPAPYGPINVTLQKI